MGDILYKVGMSFIATVDDKGRIRVPKGLLSKGDKVLVIPAGSRIILIPIPPRPIDIGGRWLKTKMDRKRLKEITEEEALKELEKRWRKRDANRE